MPDWKEQLKQIQQLRDARRQNDDNAYAASINLVKANSGLKKIVQKETALPADPKVIADLRSRIASQQASLQQLTHQISDTGKIIDKWKQNNALIDSLGKQVQATSSNLTALTKQLAVEQKRTLPDSKKITSIQTQINQFQSQLKESEPALVSARKSQAILNEQQTAAQTKTQELGNQVSALKLQIAQLSQQLNDKLKGDQISLAEAQQKKNQFELNLVQTKKDFATSVTDLHEAIGGIYVDPHPRSVVSNLDDSIPFLLMPVRIETRFITSGAASELWLRIYPDDIAIHTHEKILTDPEVQEGKKYWTNLFNAEKSGGAEKENQKRKAWDVITSLFGSQRSAWIALRTKPLNWTNNLSTIVNADGLNFPVPDLTKTDAWSRAPRTNVLPDKFVVMLYEGSVMTKEVVGELIPDELYMGPDPLDAEGSFVTSSDKTLVFGDAYNWVSDFDKAVQYGMGFKIPLTPAQASNGFDKIIVLGLCLSSDETVSKKMVEDLIDNHHYSPKGFSLVTQGTPTNNTELGGSGFSSNDPFNATSYFVETGDPLFSEKDVECDGKNLADALGIDYTPLQYILNSDARDHKEAVAMNTVLYPSTLGFYFGSMMNPVLDTSSQDNLRNFFIQHVSGRGPLPALRVGNQPYGVLLTSDFSKWQWNVNDTNKPFLDSLLKVLNYYSNVWNGLLNEIVYSGKPGMDPSELLMNILGLQSGSVSFFQRIGYSTDDLRTQDDFKYGGRYAADLQNSMTSKNELLNFLTGFGYVLTDANGKLRVPQQLRLVFQHYHTALDASNLIDNVSLSEKDPLSYYDADAKKNYINWLLESNTISLLEKQDFGADKKAPTSLLYMQLRRSLLLELAAASVKWFQKHSIDLNQVNLPVNFYNIRPAGNLTKWEVMKAKLGNALPTDALKDKAVGEYLLTTGNNEAEAFYLNKMKDALSLLANVPTARLERCFTEHLDICTYRLDAWQTALFNQRLQKQRQLQTTEKRKEGLYLGAYGWVENIKPESRQAVDPKSISPELLPPAGKGLFEYTDNGGFVQAPSLNHATAAAILRSGYLSHASSENSDTMSVNLSPERVRNALFVLEGIRNGQPLEALLGYQFERGLHDRGSQNNDLKILNAYIYAFRDAFPIKQYQVQQQGTDAPVQSVPANNVVNGLDLAETTKPYPYANINTGGLSSALQAALQEAINDERNKLQDTLDAVKDLLLSETVYQMVQGNFDRASAVTNALKNTDIPPELDIINTPRTSRLNFTNRVTIQFSPGNGNPWPSVSMTPRAIMESGLNNWIKKIIGDAEQLVCLVSHTDATGVEESEEISIDKLGLQPIDIIYIIGNELNTGIGVKGGENKTGASELESRIAFHYRKLKLLDDSVTISIRFMQPPNAGSKKNLGSILPLLRSIKSIITDCRPLHAMDFSPNSKPGLVDNSNPKGYDATDLLTRVQHAKAAFNNCLSGINNISITRKDGGGSVTVSLGKIFTDLDAEKKDFSDIDFDFANVQPLKDMLISISAFGLPDSFPLVNNIAGSGNDKKIILLDQARNVARRMTDISNTVGQMITKANAAPSIEQKVNSLINAAKLLFGNAFTILPLFSYNNPADIQLSHADKDALTAYAKAQMKSEFVTEEWLQTISQVRPKLAQWDNIRTMHELLNNDTLEIIPVQLPYRAQDSWLALEFPATNSDGTTFNIQDDTLSVIIHGDNTVFSAAPQSGLLVDDWSELIPTNEETTGISFNYNQPNAMAPQALLLAVPPVEKGKWDWDSLVGILNDTLLRAKLRAVEPAMLDKINQPELSVLLPALLSTFSQYDIDISLDYRNNIRFFADTIPVTSLALS